MNRLASKGAPNIAPSVSTTLIKLYSRATLCAGTKGVNKLRIKKNDPEPNAVIPIPAVALRRFGERPKSSQPSAQEAMEARDIQRSVRWAQRPRVLVSRLERKGRRRKSRRMLAMERRVRRVVASAKVRL